MRAQDREHWAGVCVVLTSIVLAQHAILAGDQAAANEAHKQGIETMKVWQRRLEADFMKPEGA